jgi:oxalate decarboxylase/phosphoglucose isomerase-like protein (cupin superfamily)
MRSSTVYDACIIELPKIHNIAGNITAVNGQIEVPFDIQRVYYLYDVPGGESRGGHAHKNLHQLILAGSGSFDLIVSDGKIKKTITLNRPYYGVYLPPGLWRELDNFSTGSICLVLASEVYSEEDYIRDFEAFTAWKS